MITKPCPACGNELRLPDEFFDDLNKMSNDAEKYHSVLILDFILNDLKPVLFQLAASHNLLSQAEYNRNSKYNDQHFSAKAEKELIKFLEEKDLLKEFMNYVSEYRK